MKIWHLAPVVVALLGAAAFVSGRGAGGEASIAPVYTAAEYDAKRDPAADLKATVERAQREGRTILIQVGGDWCGWCRALQRFFHQKEKVASLLAEHYLILKVNYSDENENDDFLKNYPEIAAFPHLYVLDSNGKLLISQDTEEFEKGSSYNEAALVSFLEKWAKPSGSAQP